MAVWLKLSKTFDLQPNLFQIKFPHFRISIRNDTWFNEMDTNKDSAVEPGEFDWRLR